MNRYFKWFSTEGGHKQSIIIKSLAVCAQKQEVNETNVESYRVTLHKYASTAQTFTVYAPSEVSFRFVYCVSVLC